MNESADSRVDCSVYGYHYVFDSAGCNIEHLEAEIESIFGDSVIVKCTRNCCSIILKEPLKLCSQTALIVRRYMEAILVKLRINLSGEPDVIGKELGAECCEQVDKDPVGLVFLCNFEDGPAKAAAVMALHELLPLSCTLRLDEESHYALLLISLPPAEPQPMQQALQIRQMLEKSQISGLRLTFLDEVYSFTEDDTGLGGPSAILPSRPTPGPCGKRLSELPCLAV